MEGKRLRYYRESKKYTQEKLASIIGVSKGMISLYESGERSPSVTSIIAICRALEITPNELLDFSEGSFVVAEDDDEYDIEKKFLRYMKTDREIYLAMINNHEQVLKILKANKFQLKVTTKNT